MSTQTYRTRIEHLSRDKAAVEKAIAREREEISKLQKEIASIHKSITSSTSSSSLKTKQSQLVTRTGKLAKCQENLAKSEAKLSKIIADLNRALENLSREEKRERQKTDVNAKKQRQEEIHHLQNVSREIQNQANLQTMMSQNKYVIDLSKLPTKIKVLFLASNPEDQSWLRLDEEIRAINENIRKSEYRDSVELVSRWAVRTGDLLQALNEVQPHIVHFSGHGASNGDLIFQAIDGSSKEVPKEAIAATIKATADNIRLIIFNSCFSSVQAEEVTKYIDVSIGMNTSIGDEAARVLAAQFYSAIGFGRSVQQAFDQAIAALMLDGIPEVNTPELYTKEGIDPDTIILVRP
jgi:hypothetical protein